jgi:ABC-type glycerol-3-phosphate transport system permease component
MTAGGILALVPVVIFTMLVQKHLVKGLTLGALK